MRQIHYPIFLACRDCTPHLFWKRVFENLAYKECPRGIYFQDQTIYSSIKKKEFNYSFADKTSDVIFTELYDLLSRVFGLKTKSELNKKKELFDQFQQTNSMRRSEDLWSRIKKKSLKDNLIQDYILQCQKTYKLNLDDTRKLYFYISVGLIFKLFQPTDIHMKHGSIISVEGIDLEEGHVYITRHFKEPHIKKQTAKGLYLHTLWLNYLKSI